MKSFASKIVNRQVQSLAQYLLDRFLGPYLERKIDLKQEGTQLGVHTLVINDIALRCDVSGDPIDSPGAQRKGHGWLTPLVPKIQDRPNKDQRLILNCGRLCCTE